MPAQVFGTIVQELQIADGNVAMDGDLSIAVQAFPYEIDGNRQMFAGAIGQSVTDDATNYVFIDNEGSLEIQTTGWATTTHIRLARVVAVDGLITQILNERVFLAAEMDKEVNYNAEEGESTTTSTSWQQKVSLTTPSLPAGTYMVHWYAEVKHSNSTMNEYSEVRCRANDTIELGFCAWAFPVYDDFGGFRVVELGAGVQTLDIDFRMQGDGTAYIRRARLMMWRIE